MRFDKKYRNTILLKKGEESFLYNTGINFVVINDKLPCPFWYMKDETNENRYPFRRNTLSDRDQHIVYNPKKEKLTATYFNYKEVESEYLKKDTDNHFRIKKVLSRYSPTKEEIELVAKYLNELIPEAPILITNRRKWVEMVKMHPDYSSYEELKDYRRAMMFFDLFSPELGLRIEIDSPYHDNDIQRVVDNVGENYLNEMYGIKTIRYRSFSRSLKNERYRDNNIKTMLVDMDNIVVEIYNRMKELSGLPEGIYSKDKLNLSSNILETIFGLESIDKKLITGYENFQRNSIGDICTLNYIYPGDTFDVFMDSIIIPIIRNYYGFNLDCIQENKEKYSKSLSFLISGKDW